jgi:very-short-patch-repair endonuclease
MSGLPKKCIATNNNGSNCSRKCVTDEGYCTQHYNKFIETKDITYKPRRVVRKGKWKENLFGEENLKNSSKNDEIKYESDEVENDHETEDEDIKEGNIKDNNDIAKRIDIKDDNKVTINNKNDNQFIVETKEQTEEKQFLLNLKNKDITSITDVNILKEMRPRFKLLKVLDKKKFEQLDRCIQRKIKRMEEQLIIPEYVQYKKMKCPNTGNKGLCNEENCKICFYHSFAYHPKAKYWSNKNDLKPRQVASSSGKLIWFNCPDCKHDFDIKLTNVQSGNWCEYCTSQKICKEKCDACFEKSFASVEYSINWDPNNVNQKTGEKITARDVFRSTKEEYKFICPDCNHKFDKALTYITHKNELCPFCAHRQICSEECDFCFSNSFASVEYSINWCHDLNVDEKTGKKIKPRDVYKGSDFFAKFKCPNLGCGHIFRNQVRSVKDGHECTFCTKTGQRELCADDDCNMCFNNSFASIENSKYLSKDSINPRFLLKHSKVKLSFDCPNCNNKYYSYISYVTSGSFCGCTKNKTESKMLEYLNNNYDYEIESQKRFKWCKNINCLPFDYFIEDLNLIIELDGGQHKKQVMNWSSPEETQERDKYKMNLANEHMYSVIRLPQEDVWDSKSDWENKFKVAFKKYDIPTNIFIGEFFDQEHISKININTNFISL